MTSTYSTLQGELTGLYPTVLLLADATDFFTQFDEKLKQEPGKTKLEIYESLEALRVKAIGRRKFSSYDSFRMCRVRSLKG